MATFLLKKKIFKGEMTLTSSLVPYKLTELLIFEKIAKDKMSNIPHPDYIRLELSPHHMIVLKK